FGEYHAVSDDFGLAGCEPREDCVAVRARCRAVEVLGAHASLNELVADVGGMTDAAGEHDGAPAIAVLMPVRDDVADKLRLVHAFGELGFYVVAGVRFDAAQIEINRGVNPCFDQIALLDQRCDLRALDYRLEDAAEPATVATARRGSQ